MNSCRFAIVIAGLFVTVALASFPTEAAPVPKALPHKLHPAVEKLVKLVPPPAAPQGVPTAADWAAVEKALGTSLPDDYKDLVTMYGEGYFTDEVVWLYAPKHSLPHKRVAEVNLGFRKSLHDEMKEFGTQSGPPMFPDEDGYLFVRTTSGGRDMSYRPSGKPNEWRAAPRQQVEECKVGLAELLLALAEGKSTSTLAELKGFDPPMKFFPHEPDGK